MIEIFDGSEQLPCSTAIEIQNMSQVMYIEIMLSVWPFLFYNCSLTVTDIGGGLNRWESKRNLKSFYSLKFIMLHAAAT